MNERHWWTTAMMALAVATSCFVVATRDHVDQAVGPPVPPSSAAALSRPAGRVAAEVARSAPVTLRIRAIGLTTAVSKLGLNPDGTVEVPTDFARPGWFRLGPSPGQRGSAVILGHVDSYRGPAVFFRLGALRPGKRVSVTLADHTVAHFLVDAVAMYPKAHFPARKVYGSHGYSALQLVTCGGVFDHSTGHYLSNIVVYTRLVGATIGR